MTAKKKEQAIIVAEVPQQGQVLNVEKPVVRGIGIRKFLVSEERTSAITVTKKLLTVRVGKPNSQKFFRKIPGEQGSASGYVLKTKGEMDDEYLMVAPELIPQVYNEVGYYTFNLCYYNDGTVFIVPVRTQTQDEIAKHKKEMEWTSTMREAMKFAEESWVRVKANMTLGAYEVTVANVNFCVPNLPADKTIDDYLEIGFKDKIIEDDMHPILMALRGEI